MSLADLDAVIEGGSREQRVALVIELSARLARLGASLAVAPVEAPEKGGDRNLNVKQAAARLGLSAEFVYRHADELGSVRLGRRLLFSERALERFLQRRS
jgi:excisionase family DNA binding protein